MAASTLSSSGSTSDIPETSDGDSHTSSSVTSLLDRLKPATPAEIAHKQKVRLILHPLASGISLRIIKIPQSIIRHNLEHWGIA